MTTPFSLSDQLVEETIALDPLFATSLGVRSNATEWGDTGLAGYTARAELARRYVGLLQRHADHPEPRQRRAVLVLSAALSEQIAEFELGDHLVDLSHMASSFHWYSRVFDVMPKETAEDWEAIIGRLATINRAYHGLEQRLEAGRRAGNVVAQRQVRSVIDQAQHLAGDASAFDQLAAAAPQALRPSVEDAVARAKQSTARFYEWLTQVYLPDARADDAVGEAMYRRKASRHVGTGVDPEEAYAWGWDEFHRLLAEMTSVGAAILPGGSFDAVKHLVETDPGRAAPSPEAFIDFIQERQTMALAELDGSHFDVPAALRTITVDLAPAGSPLGAYYVRPSEDFSRPGGIRYSVGDQTIFPLYHHVSTAYHEGFPGHHLQIGTAMANADGISRAHRLTVWYPGYSEGWALYAERLMHELGYYERPDYHFGMLAKHLYRATRIVVDIGLHLGLRLPAGAPIGEGQEWSFDLAAEYLRVYGFRTPDQAIGEVLRYLGWPGQAIAYKLGEREILSIRKETKERLRSKFGLRQFHELIIGNGAMRFDVLREVVFEGAGE